MKTDYYDYDGKEKAIYKFNNLKFEINSNLAVNPFLQIPVKGPLSNGIQLTIVIKVTVDLELIRLNNNFPSNGKYIYTFPSGSRSVGNGSNLENESLSTYKLVCKCKRILGRMEKEYKEIAIKRIFIYGITHNPPVVAYLLIYRPLNVQTISHTDPGIPGIIQLPGILSTILLPGTKPLHRYPAPSSNAAGQSKYNTIEYNMKRNTMQLNIIKRRI